MIEILEHRLVIVQIYFGPGYIYMSKYIMIVIMTYIVADVIAKNCVNRDNTLEIIRLLPLIPNYCHDLLLSIGL